MKADLPPPLERIRNAPKQLVADRSIPNAKVTPEHRPIEEGKSIQGLRRGFLVNSNEPKPTGAKSSVKESFSVLVNKSDDNPCVKQMEKIIRAHYESDPYLKSTVSNGGISGTSPVEDIKRILECLRGDPRRCQEIFANHPEAAESFRGLMAKLGDHFERLAEQEAGKNAPKLPVDPRVEELLKDSGVKQVVTALKAGAKIDPRSIDARNSDLGRKVRTLIETGYLILN